MLATRYGIAAIDLVHAGNFGQLVVLKGTQISSIPIADAIAKTRTVTPDLFESHQEPPTPILIHPPISRFTSPSIPRP